MFLILSSIQFLLNRTSTHEYFVILVFKASIHLKSSSFPSIDKLHFYIRELLFIIRIKRIFIRYIEMPLTAQLFINKWRHRIYKYYI